MNRREMIAHVSTGVAGAGLSGAVNSLGIADDGRVNSKPICLVVELSPHFDGGEECRALLKEKVESLLGAGAPPVLVVPHGTNVYATGPSGRYGFHEKLANYEMSYHFDSFEEMDKFLKDHKLGPYYSRKGEPS